MNTEIDVKDLEAGFSEILGRVRIGERFTILAEGRPVAELEPAAPQQSDEDVAQAVEGLLNFPRIQGISGDTVREWIVEGRK